MEHVVLFPSAGFELVTAIIFLSAVEAENIMFVLAVLYASVIAKGVSSDSNLSLKLLLSSAFLLSFLFEP